MEKTETYISFLKFSKTVLELEHNISLETDFFIKNKGRKVVFDLVNKEKGYYIEVEPLQKDIEITKIVNKIFDQNRVITLNPNISLIRQIVVTQNELSNVQRTKLESNLQSLLSNSVLIVYDIDDLKKMALKHRINLSDFEFLENQNSVSLPSYLENNQIFLGDHVWNGKDQIDRFRSEEIWESGYENNDVNTINSVKEGDLLFLKSTNILESSNFLIIECFGIVTKNPKDGKILKVNWSLYNGTIRVDGLGKYKRTFQKLLSAEKDIVLKEILNKIPDFIDRLGQMANDVIPKEKREIEVQIDKAGKFFVGLEVGTEIRDYDVIFLPNSSHGGIGQNGIAAHVLQLLGKDRTEIEFTTSELEELRYKWITVYTETKSIEVCFIVSKDINKNFFDFTDNFKNAIYNYSGGMTALNPSSEETKIFVPLLGTGQAQMAVADSFNIINKVLPLFEDYFKNPKIRINFPQEIKKNSLLSYAKVIIESQQLNAIENLNKEIDWLYEVDQDEHSEQSELIKDKIPFHLDQVVDEDRLGREPVAKAFVDLIRNDIFTEKLKHSFIVHLQGEWGAGKSSFLNFIKKNLNTKGEEWIIIDYNAWQNQHIKPPWWTLIDQIYRQSKTQLKFLASIQLRRKEFSRRIWRYTGWEKIVAFVIFALCIGIILFFSEDILDMFRNSSQVADPTKDSIKKSFTTNISDFIKLVLTLFSVVGVIYSFAKFVTVPFFINSSRDAESFMKKASDPMNKVKKHFSDLVDNINSKKQKRQLAIFIDDIDRCDKEFIVNLLEGIQTLFKEKRILYIIAGDKNWMTTSFGCVYKDFTSEKIDKTQLGEFFLEKVFQLSFRMPNVSNEGKQDFWNHILNIDGIKNGKIDSYDKLTDEEKSEIKTILSTSKSDITNPDFMESIEDQFNLTGDTVSNIVIEEKNKDSEEIKHLLKNFHKIIDTNPRAIIRLANNYTMTRSILISERKKVSEQKIFRWLVIEDLCPEVKGKVSNAEEISEIEEVIKASNDIVKRNKSLMLLEGDEDFMEGKITIEEIKTIKGL